MKVREFKKLLEGFDGDVEVYVGLKLSENVIGGTNVIGINYDVLLKKLSLFGEIEMVDAPTEGEEIPAEGEENAPDSEGE